jgi:hypothetical protein
VLVRLVDLGVALVHVLGCLDGILFRVLDYWVLSIHDLSHVCEHSCEFCEGLLNALELIMTSADCTKNRRSLPESVALELFVCQ